MLLAGDHPAQRSSLPEFRSEIDLPASWLGIALDSGTPDFFEKLLAHLIVQSGATGAGIWLIVQTARGSGLSYKASRGYPSSEPAWNGWMKEQVRTLITSRRPLVIPVNPDGFPKAPSIFVPLVWEGTGLGVILVSGPDLSLAEITRLGTLAGWATRLHLRRPEPVTPAPDLANALLASPHSAEWPGIFASHLRTKSGAWRASLLHEQDGQWRMMAVSGVVEVKRRTAESRAIEQAFAKRAASTGEAENLIIALRFEAAPGWGTLLEFEKHAATDAVVGNLADVMRVGGLVLPRLQIRGWRLALSRRLLEQRNAASPKGSRWVVAALATLLLIAGCIPVVETFEGDCELQPAQRFAVVAEVEGRIQSIDVQEGALVHTGQTLGQLEVGSLKTRLEVAREQVMEQEAQARRSQGLQDMTGYRLAKLKTEQNAQEAASLTEDIRRSTLLAPIDGKVLTKDLAQKQGTVLRLGDTFCEVGGLNAWNLQVALNEEDLSAFLHALQKNGQLAISYRLKAGSSVALSAKVDSVGQISEMAYPMDGKNVIYITVPGVEIPEELLNDLRPGFSGRARIEGHRRPWALISTRRLAQYLRLHWWL
ncbi:MAG: hypothetical protein JWL90_1817 [Chthoniobacteraceae bacterium]|nr:hypothetical protein [Chthoniobacteraceae bacterium]